MSPNQLVGYISSEEVLFFFGQLFIHSQFINSYSGIKRSLIHLKMYKIFLTLQSSDSSSEADSLANNSTDISPVVERGTHGLWSRKEDLFDYFGEFMLVHFTCCASPLLGHLLP